MKLITNQGAMDRNSLESFLEKGLPKQGEEGGHKSPPKGYPEGQKQYADPANYKYPLDTEEHVRAAISYFSKPKNAGVYGAAEQKAMWGRIKSAAKKYGIEVSEQSGPPSVEKSEKIPGGLAEKEGKTEKDFSPQAVAQGVKVEMEHTSDSKVAKEIALDHLTEDPKYYEKLKTIEKANDPQSAEEEEEQAREKEERAGNTPPPLPAAKEAPMKKAAGVTEWAQQFMGTPHYEQALQCLKDRLGLEQARTKFYSNEVSWRERDQWDGKRREAYAAKRDKERQKLQKDEEAVMGKMRTLESQLVDYRIAEAKSMKKSGIDALEEFAKAIYIGPRGGRWLDPQHTIPWTPEGAKKPEGGEKKEEPKAPKSTDSYSGPGEAFKVGDTIEVGGQQFEVAGIKQFEHAGETRHEVSVKKPKGDQVYHATIYGNGVWSSAVGKGSTLQGTSGYKHKAASPKKDIPDWIAKESDPSSLQNIINHLEQEAENVDGAPDVASVLLKEAKKRMAEISGGKEPPEAAMPVTEMKPGEKTETEKKVEAAGPDKAEPEAEPKTVGDKIGDGDIIDIIEDTKHPEKRSYRFKVVGEPKVFVSPLYGNNKFLKVTLTKPGGSKRFEGKMWLTGPMKGNWDVVHENDKLKNAVPGWGSFKHQKAEPGSKKPKGPPAHKMPPLTVIDGVDVPDMSSALTSAWHRANEWGVKKDYGQLAKFQKAAAKMIAKLDQQGINHEEAAKFHEDYGKRILGTVGDRKQVLPSLPHLGVRKERMAMHNQLAEWHRKMATDPEFRQKVYEVAGIKMKKSGDWEDDMSGIESLEEFAKGGGPFIGPRGGKWADAQHTIPWDEKRSVSGKKQKEPREQSDSEAARELTLYIENDADLYRQMFIPAVKNLVNKMAEGKYDHAQATKLFNYLATEGAKRYAKEFSGEGHEKAIFNPATRMAAAKQLADSFHDEATLGNYDEHLNKKNKKAVGTLKEGAKKEGGEGEKKPSTPEEHRTKIAKDTLKMHPAMAGVMGGPTQAEAKKYLESKKTKKSLSGIEALSLYGQSQDDYPDYSVDLEKAYQGEFDDLDELEFLEKSEMPAGQPRLGGKGGEQGGGLDGVGKQSGSRDSAATPGQGAPAPKKQKLSEDDEEDEKQMSEHKKPIETIKRSLDGTAMSQREAVAHEHAQTVSRLLKGEDDVVVGVGVAPPAAAEPEAPAPAPSWRQRHPDSMVFYTSESDEAAAALMKSDQEFYPQGAPKVTRDSVLIHQQKQCPACQGTMAKSLAVCPHCGAGSLLHQPMPGIVLGEEVRKSEGKQGPGLRPARPEADLYLPSGVTLDDE